MRWWVPATLLVACCVAATWHTLTLWALRAAVAAYVASPGKGTVQTMGEASDTRYTAVAVYLATLGVAGAVFLTWLWQQRTNRPFARGLVVNSWLAGVVTALAAGWTVVSYGEPDAARRVQLVAETHVLLTVAQWLTCVLLVLLLMSRRRAPA